MGTDGYARENLTRTLTSWEQFAHLVALACSGHGEGGDMDTRYEQIVVDAMKLPLRDRVRLAQQLASSLDDEIETDVESLWFAEAERRLEELRSGEVQGIAADEAFRSAREALEL